MALYLNEILHRDQKPYSTSHFAVKIQFPQNPRWRKFAYIRSGVPVVVTSGKIQHGGKRHFENWFSAVLHCSDVYKMGLI